MAAVNGEVAATAEDVHVGADGRRRMEVPMHRRFAATALRKQRDFIDWSVLRTRGFCIDLLPLF